MSSPEVSRAARAMAATLFAWATVAWMGTASLGAQAPEPIFADAPESALTSPATADSRPFVVRSGIASLRTAVLQQSLASPATTRFTLNLFDDVTLAVSYERVEDSRFGHRSWAGHIVDRPMSTVTLTQKGDIVTGLVTDGATSYEILGLGAGLHRIEQIDTANMPRDFDLVELPPSGAEAGSLAGPALSSPSAGLTVDIFVYYTSTLRAQLGGQAQVENRVAQSVAESNTAYQRSGINGHLALAGMAEAAIPDPVDPDTILGSFRTNPTVVSQRDASHADLMALLVRGFVPVEAGTICGIGYVGPTSTAAFSVTASRSECVYTFTHEVGHNFGAQHAEEDGAFGGPEFPAYARGYKAPDRSFRTVMAYDCNSSGPSCPRVLNYSSPTVPQAGQPTGNAVQDNARRLNETFAQVASYRDAGLPAQAPSAPRNLQAFTNGLNVTLQWLAPSSGTPTTYRGVAGTSPGAANIANVPLGLTTSVSASFAPGVYYVRIYAENAAGSSPASNEVTLVLGPPGTPSLASSVNGTTVTLIWQPSSAGGAAQDYLVDAGSASGASNIARDLVLFGTAASFPGMPAGRYFVRMRARNSAGISAPSNETMIDVVCNPPPAPQNISFNRAGFDVTVFWSAVSTPGAVYFIEVGSAPGAANLANVGLGAAASVSSPLPAGTYYVRVRAATSCGTSPVSTELTITVP